MWFSHSKKAAPRERTGKARKGAMVGPYRLERRLGQGAVGSVWLATHAELGTQAALKMIREEHTASEPVIARFRFEAEATAGLDSPYIVRVWDFGATDFGSYYYASEYVQGTDLETLVKDFGPAPQTRAVHFAEQVCEALAVAHDHGVLHRDLKPANIMVVSRPDHPDTVKVVDFGLVRAIGCDRDALTTPEGVAGTPGYLAPEVVASECRGECEVDGRADLYALGCVLYWLLTGRLVFDAVTPIAQAVAHATEQPQPPSTIGVHIDPALEDLLLACLRKNADERPRDARELRERLKATGLGAQWTREKARLWWEAHSRSDTPGA